MASHDDLGIVTWNMTSDYDYDVYTDNNFTGLEPSLEAKIDECVNGFETGQEVSCGIDQRELEQAMLDTQAGLLNCLTFETFLMAENFSLKLRVVVSLKLP